MEKNRMVEGKPNFVGGNYLTLTFCVTQDCNLACTYCYMKKNNEHKMNIEMGKKIVDFILNDKYIYNLSENVLFDFIGGEPLIEMDMISELSDYIVMKLYTMNHKWFKSYSFSFSTNGLLYGNKNVREYIKKHGRNSSFGFSIDGNKEKHNLTRVKKDGSGSYDDMAQNFKLYFSEFPNNGTKSTFSSDDLCYLKDSIIHLWNLGIKDIHSNIVYENVWKEDDPKLFESQLIELADYVIDNKIYTENSVSYFWPSTGLPVGRQDMTSNRCGAGYKSLAFDNLGNIYPCVHFIDMCISDTQKFGTSIIGNIETGINEDRLRPYAASTWETVSPKKCLTCEVGSNCGWCLAVNLEEKNGSILKRTTYLCEMHKANARANDYFWKKYEKATGYTSPRTIAKISKKGIKSLKYLFFITNDQIDAHCSYSNNKKGSAFMNKETINQGLEFCVENNLIPVFLGKAKHNLDSDKKIYYEILNAQECVDNKNIRKKDFVIYDNKTIDKIIKVNVAIYLTNKDSLNALAKNIKTLLINNKRTNLFIDDIESWNLQDYELYKKEMIEIANFITANLKSIETFQLNVLTDYINSYNGEIQDCGAGVNSIALAPNGKLYICPGFYFENKRLSIGDLSEFSNEDYLENTRRDKSGVCIDCNARHCGRCLHQNILSTGEIEIPSDMQCRISQLNFHLAEKIKEALKKSSKEEEVIEVMDNESFYTTYIETLIKKDNSIYATIFMS